MLSTFSIKVLNILIMVILNFLSDNSKINVITKSGLDTCFISLEHVLFLAVGIPGNSKKIFFLKPVIFYQVKKLR